MGTIKDDQECSTGDFQIRLGFKDWRSTLIFNGQNPEFPVELFFRLMDFEGREDPDFLVDHLSDDLVKVLKDQSLFTYDAAKNYLKEKYGKKTLNLIDQVYLVKSLSMGITENPQHFFIRVKFVIDQILQKENGSAEHWAKIFLLLGIKKDDFNNFISMDESTDEILNFLHARAENIKPIAGGCETDNDEPVQVKKETYDVTAEHFESNSLDDAIKKEDEGLECCGMKFHDKNSLLIHQEINHGSGDLDEKSPRKKRKIKKRKLVRDQEDCSGTEDTKDGPKYRRSLRAIKLKSLDDIK